MKLIAACLLILACGPVWAGCAVGANGKKICIEPLSAEQNKAYDENARQSQAYWDAKRDEMNTANEARAC